MIWLPFVSGFWGRQFMYEFSRRPNTACTGRRGFCAVFRHFSGLFFFCSQAESTPAPPPVTQTVSRRVVIPAQPPAPRPPVLKAPARACAPPSLRAKPQAGKKRPGVTGDSTPARPGRERAGHCQARWIAGRAATRGAGARRALARIA